MYLAHCFPDVDRDLDYTSGRCPFLLHPNTSILFYIKVLAQLTAGIFCTILMHIIPLEAGIFGDPPATLRVAMRAGRLMPMYYTYVLKSKKDSKLYIGYTSNLRERLKLHNDGGVPSTQNRRPLELIYYEACLVKEDAIKREKSLKTGFGRSYLKNRLSDLYSGIV